MAKDISFCIVSRSIPGWHRSSDKKDIIITNLRGEEGVNQKGK